MKKLVALLALALSSGALVACGSSSNSTTNASTSAGGTGAGGAKGATGGGGQTQKISADPSGQLRFSTSSLTAKAGSDTFDFTNDSPIPHNFTIKTSSGQTVAATPTFSGGTKSVTASLKPGTYTFECTVPGHAQGGMKGTLTVK